MYVSVITRNGCYTEKDAIIEALTDVLRDAKGNDMDLVFEDLDDFDSYQETDFSSLADLEN